MELGFDAPRKVGLAVFVEDYVGAKSVEVLGVDKEPIHVEQAGPDRGQALGESVMVNFSKARSYPEGVDMVFDVNLAKPLAL